MLPSWEVGRDLSRAAPMPGRSPLVSRPVTAHLDKPSCAGERHEEHRECEDDARVTGEPARKRLDLLGEDPSQERARTRPQEESSSVSEKKVPDLNAG